MLREPQKTEGTVQVRRNKTTGRFQIMKLEERIAPKCQTKADGENAGGSCDKHGSGSHDNRP